MTEILLNKLIALEHKSFILKSKKDYSSRKLGLEKIDEQNRRIQIITEQGLSELRELPKDTGHLLSDKIINEEGNSFFISFDEADNYTFEPFLSH